jgi:hypothetical protein
MSCLSFSYAEILLAPCPETPGPFPGKGTAGTEHPAFKALLKHVTNCRRCAVDAPCVTGDVLVKMLGEASG